MNPNTGARRFSAPLLTCLVAAVFGVLVIGLYSTADVIEEGQLLSYTEATAERVSTVGGLELTIQIEPPNRVDSLTATLLVSTGFLGILMLIALPQSGSRDQWFYALLAIGSVFLALDEILGFHESIGANLLFLQDLPGINSPEDVVFALYLLPAAAYLFTFRDKLTSSPLASLAIGAGIALFAFAALLDVLDAIMDEQAVEFASIFSLLCGFTIVALGDLARGGLDSTGPGGDASDSERQFSVTGTDAARQPQGKL